MVYTVQQLAKLANISVRTLHYYDEIGLLKPSFIHKNGYRYYQDRELMKLQQILFFRELEFSLEHMKQMFDSPSFNSVEALKDQKKLLKMKRDRFDKLLFTIDTTMNDLKKNKKQKADTMYDSFNQKEMDQYKEEARQRWGHTEAYKQSQERTKNWGKKDYARVGKEGEDITKAIGAAMSQGVSSAEVQALIAKHHQHIGQFYDCSYEMYRNLGKMYVEDPRFTAYYEKYAKGLADFMCKAIAYYCDQHA